MPRARSWCSVAKESKELIPSKEGIKKGNNEGSGFDLFIFFISADEAAFITA